MPQPHKRLLYVKVMQFPVTGLIILAAAVWVFFFSPKRLYAATIISIPFSATAIVNFPLAGSPYGFGRSPQKSIMAWQLFSVLWMVHEGLSRRPQWHRAGWFLTRRPRFALLAFLGVVVLSLCVPLIFNGTSLVPSFEAIQGNFFVTRVPLRFGLFNLTQFAYLAFGMMITILIAAENWHPGRLFSTLKLYVGSCAFVAAWGLFQFWCTVTGHNYPEYIFNTGKNESAIGYLETIDAMGLTWSRVSSVAKEPGALARDLVAALTILLVCLAFRRPVWRRGWDLLAMVLVAAVLTVSTSTTAYLGMFAALILVGIALARAGKGHWKYYAAVAIVVIAIGTFAVRHVPLLSELADFLLLRKYSGMNSGATRLLSVQVAAEAFLHYPILGAGWPTVQSWDVFFMILANTGLLGLLAFARFLLPVFRTLWRNNSKGSFLATLVLPVLAWVLISSEGGGLSFGIGSSWLVFGLAAGAATAAKMETHAEGGTTPSSPVTASVSAHKRGSLLRDGENFHA